MLPAALLLEADTEGGTQPVPASAYDDAQAIRVVQYPELQQLRQRGVTTLDVRQPEHFAAGCVRCPPAPLRPRTHVLTHLYASMHAPPPPPLTHTHAPPPRSLSHTACDGRGSMWGRQACTVPKDCSYVTGGGLNT